MKTESVRGGWHRLRALGKILAVGLAFLAGTARADRRFFLAPASTGNGSGTDAANARAYDDNFVNYRALANDPDPVVEIHFAPGTYSLRSFLFSPASVDREKIVIRMKGDGARPEDTVIRNDKPLVRSAEDRMLRFNGLGRIEIENLTFDGNWDEKMRLSGHPALNPNYKNQPINLTARTGLVRRVIVRNCGSIGYLPQSRFDNVAGTEAFPLSVGTVDIGQDPAPGAPAPWVVEDCEVHAFHPEYGGYSTIMMAGATRVAGQTPAWAVSDPVRQLVVVRRCMVRGVPGGAGIIAFGSAGCGAGEQDGGRVTFSDNVLLNASLGFNTDCGHLVNFWATNSVFLDVWSLGNIGALYPGMMDRYRVSGNSVRLSGRAGHPTYLNFTWRDGRQVTDPGLLLGRRETNDVTGIGVGAAGDFRWENNWFTTRPKSQFAPEGAEPTFRLFRKYSAADTSAGGGFQDIDGMEAAGNALSAVPWDFGRVAAMPGGRHQRFGPDTVPELTRLRTVADEPTDEFRPIGLVERVLPLYSKRTIRWQARRAGPGGTGSPRDFEAEEPVLMGAVEVSIGQPRVDTRGDLRLSARVALQPTPASGRPGTVPLRGSNVWMELSGPANARLSGITDGRGVVEFRVPAPAAKSGLLRMRAVLDTAGRGESDPIHEYQSAFATATHPIGMIVSVEASPDFAQPGGQRGRFVLRRTGRTLAELPEQGVLFRLANDTLSARWGDEFELEVPDGTRANLEPLARGAIGRVFFGAGDRTVAMNVVPRGRAAERSSLVKVQLVAGTSLPYGIDDGTATVVLHHGPEWALELVKPPGSVSTRILALGGIGPSGTNTVVHAAGTRRDAGGRESAALWNWRSDRREWEDVSTRVADFAGVTPVALGRAPAGELPVVVGNRTVDKEQSPWSTLGRGLGTGSGFGATRMVSMSEDGSWFAGIAGEGPSRKAIAWHGESSPIVATVPPGVVDIDAVGIDPDGRLACNARRNGRGVAFRTGKSAAGNIEMLAALDAASDAHVSDIASTGLAVGWSASGDRRRAVAWPTGAGGTPIELSRAEGLPDAIAVGVNAAGEAIAIAGRGGRFTTPYLVATVQGGAWKPLDDAQYVSGIPQGFEWGTPVAIDDPGWIAGNGRWQGREVAWVLRRQRPR